MQHLDGVGTQIGTAFLGDVDPHLLTGQGVPDEHDASVVPVGDAHAAVRPLLDVEQHHGAVLLSGAPRRTAPGAGRSSSSARRPDDASWKGTLTTMMPGVNSSRPLSRSALWLCSSCSHQWPTTYSGMNTVTRSRGLCRRMPRT